MVFYATTPRSWAEVGAEFAACADSAVSLTPPPVVLPPFARHLDADTGGQVLYVLDVAKALAQHKE